MKRISMLVTAIAVIIAGLAFTAPAAHAEDFHFTVVATDYSHDEASFSLENEQTIKVNGADQVSWETETSTATISPARIKAAPRIKTSCTTANRTTQSQQIWRMTHHATTVVVLPGSCLWNRGRHDNIMMGFKWYPKNPAVLVGDRHHRYRHGFSLVRSRTQVAADEQVVGKVRLMGRTWLIVRKCRNFIGGPVDVYVPSAVQLHYAADIKKHAKAVAKTRVEGTVTFNITCPNGANFNTTVNTWAYGYASAEIDYTERTRVSVIGARKAQLSIDSAANGEVSATSQAGSKVTVSGSCGDTPPPTYETPSVDVSPVACVEPGQTRDVTVTVSNPNDIADTARVTYRGQTSEKAIAAHGQTTFTYANQAAGTYSGTALLVNANKSKSFTVTVEECDVPPPYTCPPGTTWTDIDHDGVREEGECFGPPTFTQFREFNDLYRSLPGQPTTMDHFVTVDTPAGHSYTITWEAVWGSFATPSKTGQDGVQVSSTYTAPSEVPPAHPEMGLSAGYDKITVTVVDNVTGQRIVRSTAPFRIKEWPATP